MTQAGNRILHGTSPRLRSACVLLCVGIAVLAQSYVGRNALMMQGKWLYVFAVLLAWWALGEGVANADSLAGPAPRPVPFRRMAPFLAVAIGVDMVAFTYAMRDQTSRDALMLWLLALVLALVTLLAFCVGPFMSRALLKPRRWHLSRTRVVEICVLCSIMLLAAYLRLFDIEHIPAFINLDEGNDGIQAVAIVDGSMRNVFAMGMGSMTRLSTLPASLLMAIWKPDLVALRSSMALVGVAALPFLYVLARMFLSIPFSMIAVFLLAVAPANIFFSRYGVPNIEAAVVTVAFVLYLVRAVTRRSSADALACGIVGGIAVYSYHSNRALAIVAVLVLLFVAIKDWRRWSGYAKLGVIILATVLFIGAPQLGYYVANPRTILGHTEAHFWITDKAILTSSNPDQSLAVIGARMFDRAFWGFNTYADTSEHYTRGLLLDPVTGILFMIGLGICIRKQRDVTFFALGATYLTFVIVLGAFILVPPDAGRMMGLIPILCLMAGIALQSLWSMLRGARQALRIVAGVGVFAVLPVLILALNYNYFFNKWIPSRAYDDLRSNVARWVSTEDVTPFAVRGDFSPNDAQFRFVAPNKSGYVMLAWEDYLPVRQKVDRDAAFIFMEATTPTIGIVRTYYPNGVLEEHRSPEGKLLFTTDRVSPADIAAYQGLAGTYTSAQGDALPVERRDMSLSFDWAKDRPQGIAEDMSVVWEGSLFVPEYGSWQLRLEGTGTASLLLDGSPVLSKLDVDRATDVRLVLAKGWHTLHIDYRTSAGLLKLLWAFGDRQAQIVGQEYLGTQTTVYGLRAAYYAGTDITGSPVIQAIEPAFFNRANAYTLKYGGKPCATVWSGTLTTSAGGAYRFAARAFNGAFVLKIDGQSIISFDAGVGDRLEGQIDLQPGKHTIEMTFRSPNGQTDVLQLWWAPPGEQTLTPVPPSVLSPSPN